jgi:hypothetical protein
VLPQVAHRCGHQEAVVGEFVRSFGLLVVGFSVTAAGILVIFYS